MWYGTDMMQIAWNILHSRNIYDAKADISYFMRPLTLLLISLISWVLLYLSNQQSANKFRIVSSLFFTLYHLDKYFYS